MNTNAPAYARYESDIRHAIRKAYDDGYNDAKMPPNNYCGERAEREGAAALLPKLRAPGADNWQQYALSGETTAEQVCKRMDEEITRRTVDAMRRSNDARELREDIERLRAALGVVAS